VDPDEPEGHPELPDEALGARLGVHPVSLTTGDLSSLLPLLAPLLMSFLAKKAGGSSSAGSTGGGGIGDLLGGFLGGGSGGGGIEDLLGGLLGGGRKG
jgi:hypothetical protein